LVQQRANQCKITCFSKNKEYFNILKNISPQKKQTFGVKWMLKALQGTIEANK